jgi:hypothetical protein
MTTLKVSQSSLGESVGRGVFASIDIPKSSYVGLDKLIPIIHITSQTFDLMARWNERIPWVYDNYWGEEIDYYVFGYGHVFSYNVSGDVVQLVYAYFRLTA